MIAFRLLEAISHPCSKEITDITLQVIHYDFILKGCKILEPGWRAIRGNFSEDDSEPIQDIPELKVGEEVNIKSMQVIEKKTKPPVLYTEAGLLSAMESAGREIESEEERKILQGIGIGTPATRAAIIETLFKRDYIRREKKSLIPTEKGLQVYDLVKDKKIADVAMTAEWELTLQQIENDQEDATIFLKEMELYADFITKELLESTIVKQKQPELECPKCKQQQLLIWNKVIKCPDEVCNWIQFRNVCGVLLSTNDIESLLKTRRTKLIKGMQSKSGKKFDAYIVLDTTGKSSFEFPPNKQKKK